MFAWDDDKFVLPTEYVAKGRPLASLLAEHEEENISWEDKVDWISKICQALKHAHQSGIIHRDVSPVNVVVASGGIVKLVNFDLARIPNTPHPDRGQKLIERFDQHLVWHRRCRNQPTPRPLQTSTLWESSLRTDHR